MNGNSTADDDSTEYSNTNINSPDDFVDKILTHRDDGEIEIVGYYERTAYEDGEVGKNLLFEAKYLDHFGTPISPINAAEIEELA